MNEWFEHNGQYINKGQIVRVRDPIENVEQADCVLELSNGKTICMIGITPDEFYDERLYALRHVY